MPECGYVKMPRPTTYPTSLSNLFFYHILCVDTPACKLCPHLQQRATFTPRDVNKAMQLALRRISVGRRTLKALRVCPGYLEHCLEVGA